MEAAVRKPTWPLFFYIWFDEFRQAAWPLLRLHRMAGTAATAILEENALRLAQLLAHPDFFLDQMRLPVLDSWDDTLVVGRLRTAEHRWVLLGELGVSLPEE